ncbi:MAG: RS21-C6 protein [Candidatus Uhrbacteria bacterium]|nr:RS21-C6 protein [Candidatus Uhrbacteria bacterium]
MQPLKENPKLQDFQTYIRDVTIQRGFDKESAPELLMLLLEECGELAKAARKTTSIKTDAQSETFHVDLEAADVFIYLLEICNYFNIDLEQAFRDKEAINEKRTWT